MGGPNPDNNTILIDNPLTQFERSQFSPLPRRKRMELITDKLIGNTDN
jgi:hypothetical protein